MMSLFVRHSGLFVAVSIFFLLFLTIQWKKQTLLIQVIEMWIKRFKPIVIDTLLKRQLRKKPKTKRWWEPEWSEDINWRWNSINVLVKQIKWSSFLLASSGFLYTLALSDSVCLSFFLYLVNTIYFSFVFFSFALWFFWLFCSFALSVFFAFLLFRSFTLRASLIALLLHLLLFSSL